MRHITHAYLMSSLLIILSSVVMLSVSVLPRTDVCAIFLYGGQFWDYLGLTCVFWNSCVLHKGYVTGTGSQAPEGSSVAEVWFVVAGRAPQILSRGAICEWESGIQHIACQLCCLHTSPYASDTRLHLKTRNISASVVKIYLFHYSSADLAVMDAAAMFLQHVGIHFQYYTVSQPTRPLYEVF
jgi:hypothetical protein